MGPRDFIDGIRCIEVSRINSHTLHIALSIDGCERNEFPSAYVDHCCSPRGLCLRSLEEGFLVSHSDHPGTTCRVRLLLLF